MIKDMLAAIPELRADYDAFAWPHLATVCVEALVPPFLAKLTRDRRHHHRLAEILAWVETLASSGDAKRRDLVGTSICAPLLTTFANDLPQIAPYMGRETRTLCTMQFSMYKIDAATRALFGTP